MRKRLLGVCIVVMSSVALIACGKKDTQVTQKMQELIEASDEADSEQMSDNVSAPDTDETVNDTLEWWLDKGTEDESQKENSAVVLDLTEFSSTMLYSEVSDILENPDMYRGMNIKMSGAYDVYIDENTGKIYHACVVSDVTACCAVGIEFDLEGDKNYPDDYPEPGSEITVHGCFDTYCENGYTYGILINANFCD